MKNKTKIKKEITIYDHEDTTAFIDESKNLKLEDLGFTLPQEPPTKVISIRIPTPLYHQIRAFSTNIDMPYQAFMKYLLYEGIKKKLEKPKTHK